MAPVCVIGSQFMAPYPIDFIVDTNSKGNLVITDINHRIMLKVKPCNTILHDQRLLLHNDDRPIAMLRNKLMSEHKIWKVYMGDSIANSDMIFSTEKARVLQSKTNLIVLLGNNRKKKNACDLKINGSWSKRNCTIYLGHSQMKIARMHPMQESGNVRFAKDKFMLEVNANVDYAFIVAIIAVIDAMKSNASAIVDIVTEVAVEAALGGAGP
ncbi:hypothetical protein OSB04_020317 [Centaurea solstitialis]|uniref:Uncharacterized protein n=1 Tax=Centaurea solstitialis TaxID=347529 RepID=A0AA38WF42_9ASTR|nr:hypothetical protein OSB04_020317 [Centaurea solstitialis]